MAALREKIGQMILVGIQGEALTQEEKGLLRDCPFGGFVLFSRNLKEPKQILSLCRSLWRASSGIPPLIAIDQEGGRVHRLPAPFTYFPSAALLGRTGNSDLAYRVGLAAARELSAVGVNLNFAPVLDVASNPDNPVIGDRSLSADPHQAAALGWSIIQGLRDGGIIPCGKHFPGHGDSGEDSHLELPVVKKNVASLRTVELPPFVHACRNQAESLMTAHVLYPALDPDYPATLSQAIIGKLLREELGYQGIVFGDDLEMKAISASYSPGEAASLAVQAGVDVLLFCRQTRLAAEAFESLCREAKKKERTRARVEESYGRINRLKGRYLTSFRGTEENKLKQCIGVPSHSKTAAEVEKLARQAGTTSKALE